MSVEWYDMIAKRNGGYKGGYISTTEGTSAEEVFEQRLVEMLPRFHSVMDAGCGHGEFTQKYATKHLEAKTLESYSHMLKNHIEPTFRSKRLDEIKPLHVVSFLKSLEQDGSRKDGKSGGLSSTSIRFIHRILKDIFERAVEWKIIKSNPVSSVKRPKISSSRVEVYTEAEVSELLKALHNEAQHWRIMISLALTTGLRRGELLALEWDHINLEEGIIEVNQSLSYVNGENIIKPPKTKSSVRKVSIPEALIRDLIEYQKQTISSKKNLADKWEGHPDHFFVFSSWNGKPYYHTVPGTWFRRFLKRNNLKPIRFHDLRHTSATLLINQGVSCQDDSKPARSCRYPYNHEYIWPCFTICR